MPLHPLAGQPAPADLLIDVDRLVASYHDRRPDPTRASERVAFGTSGHRGSSEDGAFNEAHIRAITQAICEYRHARGITGPLFLGKDTHALSGPAERTALEVLAHNGVLTCVQAGDGYTPTPVISHAILTHNRGRSDQLADGIVVTPSHNPPRDGGFKYNPTHGGPADTDVTRWIEDRANALLADPSAIGALPYAEARRAATTREHDYLRPYIDDLRNAVDLEAVKQARIPLAVDPLGGASVAYWEPIAATYGLDLTVVNPVVDPRFAFMTVDHDGKIRMDCSSPHAMAGLVRVVSTQGARFRVAFGNDPDSDRHGIVTRSRGLLNPNHYLAVAVDYLFENRPGWPAGAKIGKTLVSSAIIDRVAAGLGREVAEVPVGFKWFVDGLLSGELAFGGEESAGASFLRRDGSVWTTDKDGILLDLLAAEITAVTGRDPGERFTELGQRYGVPSYTRVDAPATPAEKARLSKLSADDVSAQSLAGEPIRAKITRAPYGGAPIGGLKVVTDNGWFAARPSGTENVYKIYAESFRDQGHLAQILAEAQAMVTAALGS